MNKYIIHYGINLAGATADTNEPVVYEAKNLSGASAIAFELANEEAESYGVDYFGVDESDFDENRDDFLDYYAEVWTPEREKELANNWGKEKLDRI